MVKKILMRSGQISDKNNVVKIDTKLSKMWKIPKQWLKNEPYELEIDIMENF